MLIYVPLLAGTCLYWILRSQGLSNSLVAFGAAAGTLRLGFSGSIPIARGPALSASISFAAGSSVRMR